MCVAPAFITTYVTFVERCKRVVKVVFESGKLEHMCSTVEMVEKHTSVLEAIKRGESDEIRSLRLQTIGSVGNPSRYRKKGQELHLHLTL
jgi:DNA-binding FadR family transcriptional regulator